MGKEAIAGALLASARKVSGISQHEMGRCLNLTQVRVSQLEKDPSSMNLRMLASWYDNVEPNGKALVERAVLDYFSA